MTAPSVPPQVIPPSRPAFSAARLSVVFSGVREPRDTIVLSEYLIPANPIPEQNLNMMSCSGEEAKKHRKFAAAEISVETANTSFRFMRR